MYSPDLLSGHTVNSRHVSTSGITSSQGSTISQNKDKSTTFKQQSRTCSICFESVSLINFKYHLYTFHGNNMPHRCTLCGKGFMSRPGLYLHQNAHHGGPKYLCTICSLKFNQKVHLKRHLARKHNLAQCNVCSVTYPVETSNQHICQQTSAN